MKFFVEIDRETIKQIDVTMLPGLVFHARISLLLDHGREAAVSQTPLRGAPGLRRFLEEQDVPEEAIVAELGKKRKRTDRRWPLSATALACFILASGGIALAHYYL